MDQNKWYYIWNKRQIHQEELQDIDDMETVFCELKRASGFDIVEGGITYQGFIKQLEDLLQEVGTEEIKTINSIYEVGCGAGANLYYFQKEKKLRVGGIDYSEVLIECAKRIIESDDIVCGEAIEIGTEGDYNVVISNGVFSYFQNLEYAKCVLSKMLQKATDAIVILDIHELEKRDAFYAYRELIDKDYKEKYKDLPKFFYTKEFFVKFGDENNCRVKFCHSNTEGYWNNQFIFHCYLYKN